MSDTPETDQTASHEGNWDTKALRMTAKARSLEKERDEARELAEYWRGISQGEKPWNPLPWEE